MVTGTDHRVAVVDFRCATLGVDMSDDDNILQLFTTEPVRPGVDIPVFYQSGKPNNVIEIFRKDGGSTSSRGFVYAPGTAGVARISGISTDSSDPNTPGITPGEYVLQLRDGRTDSTPAEVSFRLTDAPYFWVDSFTARNTRVGEKVDVALAGLLENFGHTATFTKLSGDPWLDVGGSSGAITGTAPQGYAGRTAVIVVAAGTSSGQTSVTVRVPVRAATGPLVDELRIATWNLWYDATMVFNAKGKVLRAVLGQDVDIVSMQEVREEYGTVRGLAERLGWHYHEYPGEKDVGLMSRYPIDTAKSGHDTHYLRSAVTIGDLTVHLCSVHLDYQNYGPYAAPPGTRQFTAAVRDREGGKRLKELKQGVLEKIGQYLRNADTEPVFVLGDFNCPSHLDWESKVTSGTRNWPTTLELASYGFSDSYRVAHPITQAHNGITWSPAQPWNIADVKPGPPRVEPQDRVDFLFHKSSRLTVLDSNTYVAGDPAPAQEHPSWKVRYSPWWYNEWPSDHAMVITRYRVDAKSTT
jgi:exonuclease III